MDFSWTDEQEIWRKTVRDFAQKKIKPRVREIDTNKKIPKEIMTPILNSALTKNNIQALILSRDVGLPPPLRLPRVKVEQKS